MPGGKTPQTSCTKTLNNKTPTLSLSSLSFYSMFFNVHSNEMEANLITLRFY